MKKGSIRNTFSTEGRGDLLDKLVSLAAKISRPTNQLPYDHDQCLISTNLIFEMRMLLREIKGK